MVVHCTWTWPWLSYFSIYRENGRFPGLQHQYSHPRRALVTAPGSSRVLRAKHMRDTSSAVWNVAYHGFPLPGWVRMLGPARLSQGKRAFKFCCLPRRADTHSVTARCPSRAFAQSSILSERCDASFFCLQWSSYAFRNRASNLRANLSACTSVWPIARS